MGTPASSRFRIREDEPNDYLEQDRVWLALQYELTGNSEVPYRFSYKLKRADEDESSFLDDWTRDAGWSPFMSQKELVDTLDIDINNDTSVTVQTVGPNLLWSLGKDAVMTDKDRKVHYGELRYWNGGQYLTREDFDGASCRRIRFKAAHASNLNDKKHKFSYNVILRNERGQMVEHEIDPDMRNPAENH